MSTTTTGPEGTVAALVTWRGKPVPATYRAGGPAEPAWESADAELARILNAELSSVPTTHLTAEDRARRSLQRTYLVWEIASVKTPQEPASPVPDGAIS